MDDVFKDWKYRRFIVADKDIIVDNSKIVIVLTDITFWASNYKDLEQWCNIYGGQIQGMTVELDNEYQLTIFCLQWT